MTERLYKHANSNNTPMPCYNSVGHVDVQVLMQGQHVPDYLRARVYFKSMPEGNNILSDNIDSLCKVIAQRVKGHYTPWYRAGNFGPIPKEQDDTFRSEMLEAIRQVGGWEPSMFQNMGSTLGKGWS